MTKHIPRGLLALALAAPFLLAPRGAWAESVAVETGTLDGIHAVLFLAIEKGWYKAKGLEVTVVDTKGSATAIQQIGAGQGDAAYSQLSIMASAIDKGMDLTSIAGFIRAGDNGAMVGADTGVKVPADLAGKKIAYANGTASAALMDGFFRKAGLSRDKVTLLGVDPNALPATYISGAADAAINTLAYFGPIVATKRPSIPMPYSLVGIRVPGVGFIVRRADLEKKASVFRRFVAATVQSWSYVREGHVQEATDAMMSLRANDRLDPVVTAAQLTAYLQSMDTPATKDKPIGWQSAEDWTGALADLKEAKLISGSRPPDAYFTNRFIGK